MSSVKWLRVRKAPRAAFVREGQFGKNTNWWRTTTYHLSTHVGGVDELSIESEDGNYGGSLLEHDVALLCEADTSRYRGQGIVVVVVEGTHGVKCRHYRVEASKQLTACRVDQTSAT